MSLNSRIQLLYLFEGEFASSCRSLVKEQLELSEMREVYQIKPTSSSPR